MNFQFPDLIFPVNLLNKDGSTLEVEFSCWDASEECQEFKIMVRFGLLEMTGKSADGYFDSLCDLRIQLEDHSMSPVCYGSCENVTPSPMISAMGSGEKAYQLYLGKPARSSDLVNIFESEPGLVPTTVDSQKEFYEKWLNSLS